MNRNENKLLPQKIVS